VKRNTKTILNGFKKKLYKENILVAIKKYKFYTKKTDFMEFIIKLRQISIDLKKIKAIIN
jgi:hypothetical protein